MDILSKGDIKEMIMHREKPSISFYMPTYRKGAETQQNPIRFKNLMREVDSHLKNFDLSLEERTELLEPANQLQSDFDFWQHQSDGFAFFLAPGFTRSYRVPLQLQEKVIVGERFHVKPLLSLLSNDGRFYILTLGQENIKLFQGSRFSVSEIDLEGAPRSLAEALRFDEPERQLQFHTGAGPAKGRRAAVFHGQGKSLGTDDAEQKKNILRFFQQLDKGLAKVLSAHNEPLVLVGLEYLHPLFREASSYPNLLEKGVTLNPEEVSAEQLHEKAWKVVEPEFRKAEKRAAEKYQEMLGTGHASDDLNEIVKQAHFKRVESLFVNREKEVWGTFEPNGGKVEMHEKNQIGDQDLLDLAAIQTLMNGGTVYSVPPERVPGDADIAAVYRY